jgi:hypothetical protein
MKNLKTIVIALLSAAAFASVAHAQSTADTTSAATLDTLYQTYDEGVISLPMRVGLRLPAYDRVNGLSLPWGPKIRIPGGKIELDPTITYRSNLGKVDPAIRGTVLFGQSVTLAIFGGRGTFNNDAWIRSDLINSLTSLGVGSDARNYFRADRGTAVLTYMDVQGPWTRSVRVGGLYERDWSTGIHSRHSEAPWSFFGRTDSLRMRRINPEIAQGHISSALGGAAFSYEQNELKAKGDLSVEHAFESPLFVFASDNSEDVTDKSFTQVTLDGSATFPTFGTQTFEFGGHALLTPGHAAPPQRFTYLGGAGTLATVDLLGLGGDRLVFVEGVYNIPLRAPILPLVGAPVLSARYAAGSAGRKELPDFIQNIGVGLGLKLVKVEYHIDPNYKKTSFTQKHAWSFGLSLAL